MPASESRSFPSCQSEPSARRWAPDRCAHLKLFPQGPVGEADLAADRFEPARHETFMQRVSNQVPVLQGEIEAELRGFRCHPPGITRLQQLRDQPLACVRSIHAQFLRFQRS